MIRYFRFVILLALLGSLWACGAARTTRVEPALNLPPSQFKAPVNHYPEPSEHALEFLEIYDPWETMNRNLYAFNAGVDEYLLLPVTNVYDTVLPSPVRTGIDNVIENANEVGTLVNCLLQGKLEKSAITTSRFFINTTFGVLGVFDWASEAEHLQRQDEDFGQTLGFWGVGNGPYFVMPILGPSNVRDTFGFGGDFLLLLMEMKAAYRLLGIKNTKTVAYTELIIRALNKRSTTAFRYHETGSPFEYELVRFIYTKKRELDIKR